MGDPLGAARNASLDNSQFSDSISRRHFQAERTLWSVFQLAVDVVLAEQTRESHVLRTLAHRVWRDSFLADGDRR